MEETVYRIPWTVVQVQQLVVQLPSGDGWECLSLSFELELLLPGSKVFFFLSLNGVHSPVASGVVGWWTGNIVFGTLHT